VVSAGSFRYRKTLNFPILASLSSAASAGRYAQIIDLHRTGNLWAWGSRLYTGAEMRCHESFDCRIWQRGTAKPVLIAALATCAGPAAQAEIGAELAVSALLNILEQDMSGYLERDRLATFLRGAVGEVQLTLELQAHQDKRPVQDYASALLAVILTGKGGVVGQIGGSGALVQEEKGAWHPVRWPRKGGYAHKGRWLTDADAFAAFQIAALSSAASRICFFSSALERILTRNVSELTGSAGI
jgi:Protein phosphatase 2C